MHDHTTRRITAALNTDAPAKAAAYEQAAEVDEAAWAARERAFDEYRAAQERVTAARTALREAQIARDLAREVYRRHVDECAQTFEARNTAFDAWVASV